MIDNDLARWDYHALPAALGCRDWFTARVTTLVELDAAWPGPHGRDGKLHRGRGGRLDLPPGLAMAHQRLEALYGNG